MCRELKEPVDAASVRSVRIAAALTRDDLVGGGVGGVVWAGGLVVGGGEALAAEALVQITLELRG
jgi:type IV secretory pathway TrbD component